MEPITNHDWEILETKDKRNRPHLRCRVCRKLIVASMPLLSFVEKAKAAAGECLGSFVMPPHKSIRFVAKLSRWTHAKMPVRTASAVTHIWKSCCEPCEQRGKADSICGACACRVLPSGPAECNMIAMATEKCPIGKWT